MRRGVRAAALIAALAALVVALAYLRDPPWLGQVTSGLGPWHEDEAGRRFRWTTSGHASLYVPAGATLVTLPLRAGIARPDGAPVEASVAVEGRTFATVVLDEPLRWVPLRFALPRPASRRRFVRIEILVKRVLHRGNLGVEVGEIGLQSAPE